MSAQKDTDPTLLDNAKETVDKVAVAVGAKDEEPKDSATILAEAGQGLMKNASKAGADAVKAAEEMIDGARAEIAKAVDPGAK